MAEKVRFRNAFTRWDDVWHAFIGFTASIVRKIHPLGCIVSLIITLIYMVYQSVQAESRISSYEDIVEFIVGFIIGEILDCIKMWIYL